MAWIESHQELRTSAKVARLGRLLDISRPSVIGMLHLLWWWALDHAENGDISDFDAGDIADACCWDGDPEALVKALRECGPGAKAGFIEDAEGRWVLHDWWQYAGKLVARRRSDRDRKRAERLADPESRGTSDGPPADGARTACAQNRIEPTEPTEPTEPSPPVERRADVDELCDRLADLIEANGSKRPTITKAWRDAARLLIDKDGRDHLKALRLIEWCQADEFWRSNVLSMPTFREKYDQLRLKANGTSKPSARMTPQQRTAENADRMRLRLAGGQT